MTSYSYTAVDLAGLEKRGTLQVDDSIEAVRRIKEMGLFPTRVLANPPRGKNRPRQPCRSRAKSAGARRSFRMPWGRVPSRVLCTFTRQMATMLQAGMPLLRGLRVLEEQEENRVLRRVIGSVAEDIEAGNSLAEALSSHTKVFNSLYINMVKAGELGGSLELALTRMAEFMEKARRIQGKVKAALAYPLAVLVVAAGILTLMMAFVVPRFTMMFDGLVGGRKLPGFTLLVINLSNGLRHHALPVLLGVAGLVVAYRVVARTRLGREAVDRLKLSLPAVGTLLKKLAISRFCRTFGTLTASGVPMLQALAILEQTAGNVLVGRVIAQVRNRVKEGDPIAPTLKSSGVFPPLVASMVEVGEQTGALPEMLLNVADVYDEEVDNAATALTSLLEPLMIVLLAVIVGSIVIAMFLPLIKGIEIQGAGPGEL